MSMKFKLITSSGFDESSCGHETRSLCYPR
nr:MAG TPA: hypothetical protein [Caudoviricetes sp.]